MPDRAYIVSRTLEIKIAMAENNGNNDLIVTLDVLKEILALLKEQEAKPQRYKESDIFHIPICPNTECSSVMNQYWHYCPYCGTRFAWDEELDKLQLLIASAAKDAK